MGFVFTLELGAGVELVDPVMVIEAWLKENNINAGETYALAQQAILWAKRDAELLIFLKIPADVILKLELPNPLRLLFSSRS
jgi:hypothetical protein